MKRTDIERRDRDLKRLKKKEDAQERREEKNVCGPTGLYTEQLFKLFFFDEEKIYNINKSVEILDLLSEMKKKLPEKDLENTIRKAIRLTKIKSKKSAFDEISNLIK